MAQVLVGYDKNGNIQRFDSDGDLTAGSKLDEVVFLTFSRLLVKDEIQKGTFSLELGVTGAYATPFNSRVTLKDTGASSDYRVNSPAGDYGILYANNSVGSPLNGITGSTQQAAGLIYYQAGVAVVTASVFTSGLLSSSVQWNSSGENLTASFTGSLIEANADSLRHRFFNLSFNNTVELNSTIYFCHIGANEFNYSSNPTYLSGSQIRIKNSQPNNPPISYATTIGLYSSDNQLMATAKLSEPIKKTSANSLTFRVRLDY